jgi:hypothetical protein
MNLHAIETGRFGILRGACIIGDDAGYLIESQRVRRFKILQALMGHGLTGGFQRGRRIRQPMIGLQR